MKCSFKRFEERFVIENADGSDAQLPGPEAVRQFHTYQCEMQKCLLLHLRRSSPAARRSGGFLRKGKTTIYVDSRKRVAGLDSDFKVDLGKSLHLRSNAWLADSFLSTDRGRYLYWVDACPRARARALGWRPGQLCHATYSETTNSLSVAYDGSRLILNDLEQQFPDAADPAAPPLPPSPSAWTCWPELCLRRAAGFFCS